MTIGDGAVFSVAGFRLSGLKRRVACALFPNHARLKMLFFNGLAFPDFDASQARAREALASSRSQRKNAFVNSVRLGLFRANYNFWRGYFARRPGSVAITWNGLVSSRRIFMQAARDSGVRTLFLERGPFPGTLTADPVGVNFRNGLPREAKPYLAWLTTHPEADGAWRPVANGLKQRPATARHQSGDRVPPPLEDPFVFLPLQKQGDTQLRFFGKTCTGVRETVAFVATAARALPTGWHIRLKQHPSDNARFPGLLAPYEELPIYLDNDTETFSQVRASRLVLTVNSSVGLEAMLLGARVGVMGDAFWAIEGAVADAGSAAALNTLLSDPDAAPADPAIRNALLSFLVAEYYPHMQRDADGQVSFSAEDLAKLHRRISAGWILDEDGNTP